MGYMSVLKHTDTQLRLLREPTFLSKAVFVGFFIGILGIFLYGSECFFFKVLIGLCAVGLSFFIVDNYEICEFDKATSEVRLTRLHWCQYMLGQIVGWKTHPYVKAKLEDVKDVRVEEQGGNSSGRAYQVILSLDTGIQLGVTEVFTTDNISDHEGVANLIRGFLGDLPPPKVDDEADDEGEEEELSSSDDDFEQISRADVEDLEAEEAKKPSDVKPEEDIAAAGDAKEPAPLEETDAIEQCAESAS